MGQEPGAPAWPTLTYRSRLQDTIIAVVISVGAAGGWIGSVWALVVGEVQGAGIAALSAVVSTGVAWFLWLNRRQHVVLTETHLIIQRRLARTRIPYAQITNVTVGFVRGVMVETEDGVTRMLPWPPMRTASGGGLSRAREVHEGLSRRVEATRAGRHAERSSGLGRPSVPGRPAVPHGGGGSDPQRGAPCDEDPPVWQRRQP